MSFQIFYTDQYSNLMRQMTQSQYANCVCTSCVEKVACMAMLRGPVVLAQLDDLCSQALYRENIYCTRRKSDTAGCREYLREWKGKLEKAVERVEPMSSFLGPEP